MRVRRARPKAMSPEPTTMEAMRSPFPTFTDCGVLGPSACVISILGSFERREVAGLIVVEAESNSWQGACRSEGDGQAIENPADGCPAGKVIPCNSAPLSFRLRRLRGELVEQCRLGWEDLSPRLIEAEPSGTVDLRELLPSPGPPGPLERKSRALQGFRVAIAFEG